MKAVVMAGGEGSRLRPLTLVRPKPMLPVVNRPVLGHILHLLKQHNITDVVMTVQYLATQIEDYFGDGRSIGMNIEYVVEESPLGTAGSVRNASDRFCKDEPVLVISGDALTDMNLTNLLAAHGRSGASLTMALARVSDPLEYGVINIAEDGRVLQFLEKPSWGAVTSDTVNTGIYVVEPEVLSRIPEYARLDWSQDIFPGMLRQGAGLYGYVDDGYWCDVGSLSEYLRANVDLLNNKLELGNLGQRIGADIFVGGQVEIASDVQLIGPIYMGQEVKIRSGAFIQGPTVIRDYTIVDSQASIQQSIIWRNCYIGEGVTLRGAVVGRQCSLKARSVVFEGAVIGDKTIIGEGAIIQAGVKIWPDKEVERGATVNHSVIWGSQGRRLLFSRYGVTGVVNVDLTPDFVARLGAAFGSCLPKGGVVTINRDPNRSARMIKRALISGLPSAGNHVADVGSLPIPVARYYTRAIKAAGGVHVRLSPYDPRVVDIRFMGPDGLNLTREQERTIERVFFREDYRRAFQDDIGNIDYAPDAPDVYAKGFLKALDVAAIRAAGFKVVVDYAHAPTAEVLPELLNQLNVDAVPLNARVDATKLSSSQEEARGSRAQLARIVRALDRVSFGARLDVGGEKLVIADDQGRDVPNRVLALAMAVLVFRSHAGATVAIAVDQPGAYEEFAAKYGGKVRRIAAEPQTLMRAATEDDVMMAADGAGNFVFPALYPGVDGLFAVGKLLEMLAQQEVKLSDVIADLPPFHMATSNVEGVWESKGRVMRCLIDQFSRMEHETIDGIKVHLGERTWVLIYPDNDTATFHLTAEAKSDDAALSLIADYDAIVRRLSHEPIKTGEAGEAAVRRDLRA